MTETQSAFTEAPRAREYETIYILRSGVDPDEADRIATRIREVVTSLGGKILRVDNWGRRRLAHPIGKATRGIFVYLRYVGLNNLVAEIERNLRIVDDVIRHQTVLLKERVKLDEYVVDPADVEFRRVEVALPEEEQEPELAQRLGLVERPRGEYGREPIDDLDPEALGDGSDDVELPGDAEIDP
jgi:small subunit ribosomal protein S6